jgi:hypothetical protein
MSTGTVRLMFFQVRDAIKYCPLILLFISLPGKARQVPDSLEVTLPDTSLTVENILFLIEERTSVYFSYNPEIFEPDLAVEWSAGEYTLHEILQRIGQQEEVLHTWVGNQVVFYRKGEEPIIYPAAETAEPEPALRRIRGRILGPSGKEPLPYAAVWMPKTWEGTIANSEGYFAINFAEGLPDDTLAISCMGYKTRYLLAGEFHDSLNIIYMQESIIPIQEVVIRRTDPLHLLEIALDRIPLNYSGDPVLEKAFYRETIQKEGAYLSISEAVVDLYKPGYSSASTEQVKVIRGRKNSDFSDADTLMVKLKAGLETSFLLDFIRYRPDFLIEKEFVKYDYSMSDIVDIQDRTTYAIDFRQREGTPHPHYRGRIFIDLQTYAFRGLEFEVIPGTLSSVASSMIHKKPRKVRVRPLSASYQVRYRYEGNHFYLSLIRTENRFRVRPTKKLIGNEFRIVSEMAITALEKKNVKRFRSRETANPNDIFIDMLGGYDPDFWGPYNYLIPEESLEDALIRISRLMESRNLN